MDSNTGENRPKGAFVKGDPRINRKGRPKSFDALRALAQQLANEIAKGKDGGEIVIDDHKATNTEMLLRALMRENPERFIEIAFGKVPNPVEVTGKAGGPIEVAAPLTDEERARRVKALLANGD